MDTQAIRRAMGLVTLLTAGWLAAAAPAFAQTYLDNQTLYSNQDPNTETRRSDHFRMNFGHYNRDTGTPMTEEMAQGNLQMYEQMWNRWVNEMGLHDINESTNQTYVDGNKYRTNFDFLMTWNDGGGGGAYSSSDSKGFFYAMGNTSYCRFDPPSGATPHEMGHVWEGSCAGFNSSNSSGAWWECTANWMLLQFLNAYPQAAGYLYNSVFYPAHGRDYYDSWMIWEAAKEDSRYGSAWVNSVWTNATADQKVNEYILDRMIRLDTSGSADKAGAIKDLWGDMAKKMITWDYARQRWLAQANTPWNGDTWEWYTRCRAPLVKLPGTTGWYRPAREHMPQQFGFHFVPLAVTAGTTVSCNFQPLSDFVRQSDWRACLVAVNTAGEASYSSLWNIGTNSITLSADQSQLYLMVIATPKPMKIIDPAWQEYTRDSGLQFPYTVAFTNASPQNVIYPGQGRSGMVQHANGGGWKSSGATVDATAYIGPNAQVLDSAQVKGNARIEEYAVVRNSAQVRDNAVVSGHGMVYENAQVYGNAKVRDWAMICGYAELYENAKAIEHAGCGGGSAVSHNMVYGSVVMKGVTSVYSPSTFSGSLITDGDTANGNYSPGNANYAVADHGVHFGWQWGQNSAIFPALTDNKYQYSGLTFERDNAVFACDELGINHGYLMNGCRTGIDSGTGSRGGRVLPLDGTSQYVELHNSLNDFKDSTFAVWCKQSGAATDQRLWSLGDGTNKVMYLTPSAAATAKPRFVITDGVTTLTLDSSTAIPLNTWRHLVVVFSGSTCTRDLNGVAVATNAAMTLLPDSLNAPLMGNANFLGRGNAGNYFQGSLDEFRVYNKALSAAEVTTLYSTAAPTPITVTADTTAPTPNAATWLVPPMSNGDSSASMSATPGTDASGWVEYYFTCVSGGGHDSGWVSFNKYTDVGLTPGSAPGYTVKMRDRNGNTTASSATASVTLATSSAGSASFSYGPIGIADGQITMTAVKSTSASGKLEYKFDRSAPTTASSGWQSTPTWTNTGLTAGTSYTYTVTIRDGRGNTSGASAPASALASDTAGPALPITVAHWQMQPYPTIDNKVCMTATPILESGVQVYYQCESGGGPDSGWLAATTTDDGGKSYYVRWTSPMALADDTYSYKYKLKDAAGNESAYSTTYSAKINLTTGYHTCTLAQALTGADDNLVSFPATVLKANADNYQVKDLAGGGSITVKPGTYAQVTDPTLALKNVTVKGHLYTFAGVRVVTYASLTVTGTPTLNTIAGRVTDASGTGIAGATLCFSDVANASANPIVTATTDASGNYSRGVSPGTWYVAVTSRAYNTSADQSVVAGATNVSGINFTLVANTSVTGTVIHASDGTPLAGASVYFSRSAGALGSAIFTATTDAGGNYTQAVQDGIWYVSAGANGYYAAADKTISVNGVIVSSVSFALALEARNIPRSSDLWFSAITDSLPDSGAAGPWPTYQPVGQTLTPMGSPTMAVLNSRKWTSNLYADGDGFLQGTYADPVPINGATIIVAARPTRNTTGTPATSIVNFFYDRLSLGIRNSTGQVDVYRNGTLNTSTTTIPTGQTTILSLVMQPTGQFKVWANGTLLMNITTTSDMTSLVSNILGGYSNAINIGRYNSDAMTTFNGGIGDVFVYKVALSDAERLQLEADVTAKFVPSYYTVTSSAGTGGYINPVGVASVSPGGSETFTIRPLAGQMIAGVTVDGVAQGVIAGYTFSNVTANHTLSATFKAGANTPPAISALGTQQIAANGNSGPLAFTVGDAETTAANLTLSAVSSNPAVMPGSNMVFGGSGANRTVTLTPAASMIGSATITLTVSDGLASTNSIFLVNVTSPAGAPSLSAVADQTVDEDHATPAIALTLADSNTPVTSLTLTGASSNPALVSIPNIVFSGSGATRSVVITPLPNQFGTTYITLTVSDGVTPVGIAFQLTVNPVNAPPTIGNVADQALAQDTATAAIAFVIGDRETASSQLRMAAASSNPALVPVSNIVLGGSGANRTVVLTPAVGKIGTATITLTVGDGNTTASTSFVLTVNPVVSPPTISMNVGVNGALAPGDAAGAMAAAHWNNLLGANNPSAAAGSLVDRTGVAVAGMTASFQGGQNTFNAGSSPDTNLLSGFLSGSTMSATLAGVPYPIYDVYVYYNGFSSNYSLTWRASDVTGTPVVLATQYSVRGSVSSGNVLTANGNSHVLSQYATLAAADAAAVAGTGGTYLKFAGLTAASIKIEEISNNGNNENGFSGIQIVNASAGTPPVVGNVPDLTVSRNTSSGPLPFSVADAETAAASLTVTATSSNTTIVPGANIVLGGSGGNRTVTITPASNQTGASIITLSVGDGTFTTTESFLFSVEIVNQAPTVSTVADLSTNEDTPTTALPFTVGDDTTPADSLVVTAVSSNTTLVPNANIALGGSGANRTVMLTPVLNQNGSATITLSVGDGLLSTTEQFVLTVIPVNDPPTISYVADQAVAVNTATSAIPFIVADVETPVASLVVTGSSSNHVLVPDANVVIGGSGGNRTVTVTPVVGLTGSAVIALSVTDGSAITTGTFALTVNPPNTPPTIGNLPDLAIYRYHSTGALAFSVGDIETAAGNLVVTAVSSNTTLVPNANIVLGGGDANRTLTINPASGLTGTATITVTVSDGTLAASTGFVLTVLSAPGTGWTGGGADTNWSTAANWGGAYVSGSGADLVFSGTAASLISNNDAANDVNSVGSITFEGGAASYTISGKRFLLFGDIANNSTNRQTFSATPNFDGRTIAVGGSGNLDFSSIYSNTAGAKFVKTGAGAVLVKPGADLTFKGAYRVEAGTLTLDRTSALVFNSLSSLEMAGGQVTYTVTGAPSLDSAVGTAFVAGSSSKIYVTQGTSSRAKVSFGALSRAEGATNLFAYSRTDRSTMTVATDNTDYSAAGGKQSILGGAYVLQGENTAAEFAFAYRLTGDRAGGGTTLPNQLQALGFTGTPYSVSLTATADVDLPIGASASSSGITINSLRFNTVGAATLNLSAGDLKIASGGILATPNIGANAIAINNGNLTSSQAELFIHQYNTGTGTRTMTISSAITDNPGSVALVKAGAGLLALNGANTFSGKTYINAGTLQLTNSLAMQNSTLSLNSAGTGALQFGASLTAATLGGVEGTRNLSLLNQAGTPVAVALSVGNNGTPTVYSGTLSGNAASVTKIGTGTLTLTGTHTYTGATAITGGSLLVTGSLAAGSAVTVGPNGTLGGTGTISGPTTNQGTICPGVSVGSLNLAGGLTLAADCQAQLEFGDWTGAVPGTGWDMLNCAGLTLSGTPAHPIVLKLLPLSLVNFTEATKTFTIATSATAISGFAANAISINSSAMPGTGTWSAQLDVTGKQLQLVYTQAGKAVATVSLTGLTQTFDGTPKSAAATTVPAGLAVTYTYDGATAAPTHAGSYAVVATINDASYQGSASGTLVILTPFSAWQSGYFTAAEISAGLAAEAADPDHDGSANLAEFAFNGDPRDATSRGRFVSSVTGGSLTFTCAVRRGAVFASNADHAQVSLPVDGVIYTIEGTSTLTGLWNRVVIHQGTSDTPPAGSGLPDLTGSGWKYHTFSAFNGLPACGFLHARVVKQ